MIYNNRTYAPAYYKEDDKYSISLIEKQDIYINNVVYSYWYNSSSDPSKQPSNLNNYYTNNNDFSDTVLMEPIVLYNDNKDYIYIGEKECDLDKNDGDLLNIKILEVNIADVLKGNLTVESVNIITDTIYDFQDYIYLNIIKDGEKKPTEERFFIENSSFELLNNNEDAILYEKESGNSDLIVESNFIDIEDESVEQLYEEELETSYVIEYQEENEEYITSVFLSENLRDSSYPTNTDIAYQGIFLYMNDKHYIEINGIRQETEYIPPYIEFILNQSNKKISCYLDYNNLWLFDGNENYEFEYIKKTDYEGYSVENFIPASIIYNNKQYYLYPIQQYISNYNKYTSYAIIFKEQINSSEESDNDIEEISTLEYMHYIAGYIETTYSVKDKNYNNIQLYKNKILYKTLYNTGTDSYELSDLTPTTQGEEIINIPKFDSFLQEQLNYERYYIIESNENYDIEDISEEDAYEISEEI